jgi:hypothetical protein
VVWWDERETLLESVCCRYRLQRQQGRERERDESFFLVGMSVEKKKKKREEKRSFVFSLSLSNSALLQTPVHSYIYDIFRTLHMSLWL